MTEELKNAILGVKCGKYECFEFIRTKYEPLISEMAQSFEKSGAGSFGDLSEEAESALLKSVLNFDTEQSDVTFGLYAKICIRNALISVRRAKLSREKRDRRVNSEQKRKPPRKRTVFEGLEEAQIMAIMKDLLSEYEFKVFSEYLKGSGAGSIAVQLGTSERSVNNALYRIRRKARKASDAKLN